VRYSFCNFFDHSTAAVALLSVRMQIDPGMIPRLKLEKHASIIGRPFVRIGLFQFVTAHCEHSSVHIVRSNPGGLNILVMRRAGCGDDIIISDWNQCYAMSGHTIRLSYQYSAERRELY
jgi:hypothetical protein